MGVPLSVGSEKGGPHQPRAVGVSLCGPTHVPPLLLLAPVQKSNGLCRDNKVPPG